MSTEHLQGGRRPILDSLGVQVKSIDSLSPAEIIERGIKCQRLETILLGAVITEDALIDSSHADHLGQNMLGDRGQISPITVRARLDEGGEVVYDVVDGFHRTEGRKRTGQVDIMAEVIYNCPDDELYDLRILAASSVRSVQIPRLIEWMTKSWETTPWALTGMTIAQAFALADSNTRRSLQFGLEQPTVGDIKMWAADKARLWGKTVGSTYQILRVASLVNPVLVRQVRTESGGHKENVTFSRLELVAEAFPGEEYHLIQRMVLEHGVANRYSTNQLGIFIAKVKLLLNPNMAEGGILSILQKESLKEMEVPAERKRKVVQTPDDEGDGDDDTENGWDEIEPADEELGKPDLDLKGISAQGGISFEQDAMYMRRYVAGDRRPNASMGRGDRDNIPALQARVQDLERALAAAIAVNKEGGSNPELWWRTAIFLVPQERLLMEEVMYKNRDLEWVARSLKMTVNQAIGYIRSAFTKRQLAEPERRSEGPMMINLGEVVARK